MNQAKSYICDLNAYQPGLPIELVARQYGLQADQIIKLASNENPRGMGKRARQALVAAAETAHRYPDQYELTQALATHYGLDPSQVVLGNGSNDVLDLVARTYLGAGDEAISSQYAFIVYVLATQSTGATNVVVLAAAYGHDLSAMAKAVTPQTKVVWIANPNNPTGTFVPHKEVEAFLRQLPESVMVVLDEAYYEYLDPEDRTNTTQWLKKHPNLILVRTFSKIHGLAGLRMGYALAAPEVAELMNRVRQPFNANNLALAAATAALGDAEHVKLSFAANQTGRTKLLKGLKDLGLETMPAYGNFVTARFQNATAVNQRLLEQGVIVRPLAGYGLPEWLRITVGTEAEVAQLLECLKAVAG